MLDGYTKILNMNSNLLYDSIYLNKNGMFDADGSNESVHVMYLKNNYTLCLKMAFQSRESCIKFDINSQSFQNVIQNDLYYASGSDDTKTNFYASNGALYLKKNYLNNYKSIRLNLSNQRLENYQQYTPGAYGYLYRGNGSDASATDFYLEDDTTFCIKKIGYSHFYCFKLEH